MAWNNPVFRRRLERGKASDYIRLCDLKPGDLVVLWCRVSRSEQNRTQKLNRQVLNLRAAVERMGAVVVAVVTHVGPGWDPEWLVRPTAIAKRHGAALVAEAVSRMVRSHAYHSVNNPEAQANEFELQELRRYTYGVELLTLLDPDATPGEERAYQTKRGQKMSGRVGGRPPKKPAGYKKERYLQNRVKVRWCVVAGIKGRRLARFLNVPDATARAWVRRFLAEQQL
jgi:hypothetical protein